MFWDNFYKMCLSRGTKPNPVAKEIGISAGILTKWKTTGTIPNGETLVKIAEYLHCSVDYLVGAGIHGQLAQQPQIKPLLAGALDRLLGPEALSVLGIPSTAALNDDRFGQLASLLVASLSYDEQTMHMTVEWKPWPE